MYAQGYSSPFALKVSCPSGEAEVYGGEIGGGKLYFSITPKDNGHIVLSAVPPFQATGTASITTATRTASITTACSIHKQDQQDQG
ncbi:unnamed protein product [Ectocarpus sp. 6 AP-2014]